MVTHFITEATFNKMVARGVSGILMLRGHCGTKATMMASLDYTQNVEFVTCKRCLNKLNK